MCVCVFVCIYIFLREGFFSYGQKGTEKCDLFGKEFSYCFSGQIIFFRNSK